MTTTCLKTKNGQSRDSHNADWNNQKARESFSLGRRILSCFTKRLAFREATESIQGYSIGLISSMRLVNTSPFGHVAWNHLERMVASNINQEGIDMTEEEKRISLYVSNVTIGRGIDMTEEKKRKLEEYEAMGDKLVNVVMFLLPWIFWGMIVIFQSQRQQRPAHPFD